MDLLTFTGFFFAGLARFVNELGEVASPEGRVSISLACLVRDLLRIYNKALKDTGDATERSRVRV